MDGGIEFILSNNFDNAWLSGEGDEMVDAVLIQRPVDLLVLDFIKEWKSEKRGIIAIETDDDLENLPYSNPAYEILKGKPLGIYTECLQLADYVHCSTPELVKSEKYIVFANGINLDKYNEPLLRNERSVGWAGSPTHLDSLLLIKPVINELLISGVNVVLCSNREWLEYLFAPHSHLTIMGWADLDKAYLLPSIADVNLTPLPNNKFTRGKSELKVIEAAAWGIPSVSSSVSPYTRFNKLSGGGNVIVKKERPKEWLKEIYKLLEDEGRYKECSEKSLACVKDMYDLHLINQSRQKWWHEKLYIAQ